MVETVRVVTDSSCDLPPDLLDEYAIEVVPLTVHFGQEVHLDGELSSEEFWQKARGPEPPKTSQPAVGAFEEVFERLVREGKHVLCATITGQHSGTFNAAQVAAQRFGEAVRIFDSLSLSLGLGFQALAAARAARKGLALPQILDLLEGMRSRTRLLIVLDTLEYLRRGGRADAFMAVAERMTRALNIRVIINVVDGQLRLMGAARSFNRALQRVLGCVEQLGPLEELAVVHTLNLPVAEEMASRLAELTRFPRERIWLRETGAVLASHAGPGVLGVLAVTRPAAGEVASAL